jgi:hypothetical protein
MALSPQVCLIGTTAYPGCVSSATGDAKLRGVFFSEAAWDNGGSIDIQPTPTMTIAYPYCVASSLSAGLPGAACQGLNLASPLHTSTFTMGLKLATPRPLDEKSCFLLSGTNAFNPVRPEGVDESATLSGVGGWTFGTLSDATCDATGVTKVSRMVNRLCRSEVTNFTSPYANNTVISGQVCIRYIYIFMCVFPRPSHGTKIARRRAR